jgi:tetratricopeptide (TPR) repeat protein
MQISLKNIFMICICLNLAACATVKSWWPASGSNESDEAMISKPGESAKPLAPPVRGEKEVLSDGEKLLDQHNYEAARKHFREFIAKNPYSHFLWLAKFDLAQSYDGIGDLRMAQKLYSEVSELAYAKNRPLSLMAHYRLSFLDEAEKKYDRAVGHLLTIKRNQDDLPKYFPKAEIHSRLAAFYGLLGQPKEQMFSIREADAELSKWEKSQTPERRRAVLPQILYRMGQSSGGIRAHRAVQPFLIRTLEFTDSAEAERALRDLQKSYADYFADVKEQVMPDPIVQEDDEPRGKGRKRSHRKVKAKLSERGQWNALVGEFTTLLEEAKIYQPTEAKNSFQQIFFKEVDEYRREIHELVYTARPKTPLSQAAIERLKGRSSVQREATIVLPLVDEEL